jgi:hypothetical protein
LVCISQAGFEPASGSTGALLFSQCNVAWRSFVWAGGSGVRVLFLLGVFFSAKGRSSVSAKVLIYGAHAVCFLPLVSILDSSPKKLSINYLPSLINEQWVTITYLRWILKLVEKFSLHTQVMVHIVKHSTYDEAPCVFTLMSEIRMNQVTFIPFGNSY